MLCKDLGNFEYRFCGYEFVFIQTNSQMSAASNQEGGEGSDMDEPMASQGQVREIFRQNFTKMMVGAKCYDEMQWQVRIDNYWVYCYYLTCFLSCSI